MFGRAEIVQYKTPPTTPISVDMRTKTINNFLDITFSPEPGLLMNTAHHGKTQYFRSFHEGFRVSGGFHLIDGQSHHDI